VRTAAAGERVIGCAPVEQAVRQRAKDGDKPKSVVGRSNDFRKMSSNRIKRQMEAEPTKTRPEERAKKTRKSDARKHK
jgi:hypothetical protein